MAQSSIGGRAVPLPDAIDEAARLIAKSRRPLVAGLGADIAGARAALRLAAQIGASFDHMHSSWLLRDLDVAREHGVMLTTPGEARLRADVVLAVGAGLAEAGLWHVWPDMAANASAPGAAAARRILRIDAEAGDGVGFEAEAARDGAQINASFVAATLSEALALVRARVAKRPVRLGAARVAEIDAFVAQLRSAAFGVAVWSAGQMNALSLEMLCGLVRDLNAATRFTGLALQPGDNAAGVLQACGWTTGLPMRTSFGRGDADHDPWAFEAGRLMASGEADCAVWISAYGAPAPNWPRKPPLIALCGDGAVFAMPPSVEIRVGRPGVDHAGIDYCARAGTLSAFAAERPTDAPSVAYVLDQLSSALARGAPC